MVDEQAGLRSNPPRELPLWTKLFSGFKVALDPKKLLLAAAGIFVMAFGWWVLSVIFYGFSGNMPEWADYVNNPTYAVGDTPQEKQTNAWLAFKEHRRRWNLSYAMFWPVPDDLNPKNSVDEKRIYYDEADAANTYEEYADILEAENRIKDQVSRLERKVRLTGGLASAKLQIVEGPEIDIKVPMDGKEAKEAKQIEQQANNGELKAGQLQIVDGKLLVNKVEVTVPKPEDLEK